MLSIYKFTDCVVWVEDECNVNMEQWWNRL